MYQRPVVGVQMVQQPLISAPKQKFTNLKIPTSSSWKKPKVESKTIAKPPKRAASNNSSTSNKENTFLPKQPENAKEEQNNFSFPDGGWVCSFCQNYNFYGRVRCNRCTKNKTTEDCEGKPQHIIRKELKAKKKNDENNNNLNKMSKFKKQAKAVKIQQVEVPQSNPEAIEGTLKSHSERVGDWVCFSCSNLNFSFRKICNRCKMTREESDMQYQPMPQDGMEMCGPMMGYPFPGNVVNAPYPNMINPLQPFPQNNNN